MADFMVNAVTALFNAEEGTTLAAVATVVKYCLLMAVPFVGWSIVELFFRVINNPLLFAGLWLFITAVGSLMDYFNNGRRSNTSHRLPTGIPPLLDYRISTNSEAENSSINNNEINNNFHQVQIHEQNSQEEALTIPDVGTQTPKVSEPVTPTNNSSPGTPKNVPEHGISVRPQAGTRPAPQAPRHKRHKSINGKQISNEAAKSVITAADPLAQQVKMLASQLAKEKAMKEARTLPDDTTWILQPPTKSSTAEECNFRALRLPAPADDPEDFVEIYSAQSSALFSDSSPDQDKIISESVKDKNANK